MAHKWWVNFVLVWIILIVLWSCGSPAIQTPVPTPTLTVKPSPSPTSTPVPEGLIIVDQFLLLQTVRDVGGGNFIHKYSGREEVLDPVGALNIETLGTQHARVWMGLKEWEDTNDNDDPENINWVMYEDDGNTRRTFQLMQDFQAREMEIIATIWEVPDWMVFDPTSERARWIPPTMYAEAVESIATWLIHARDTYGVEVDYISFNEPILGVSTALTSQEQRQLIKQSGARFDQLGLATKWLLGDCAGIGSCLMYAQYIYDDADVRPYLGPLAVHSWDALESKPSDISKVADYVQSAGLELWVTEGGWDPFLYARPEEFSSWNNALRLSATYNRVLQLSHATVIMYWEFLGDDYSTNDGVQPYPVLDILQQLTQAFPAGTVILQTGVNTPHIYAVAGQTPSGYVLHIVNTSDLVKRVEIRGMPQGRYSYSFSTSQQLRQDAGILDFTGVGVTIDLVPESVHVLDMQP